MWRVRGCQAADVAAAGGRPASIDEHCRAIDFHKEMPFLQPKPKHIVQGHPWVMFVTSINTAQCPTYTVTSAQHYCNKVSCSLLNDYLIDWLNN